MCVRVCVCEKWVFARSCCYCYGFPIVLEELVVIKIYTSPIIVALNSGVCISTFYVSKSYFSKLYIMLESQ